MRERYRKLFPGAVAQAEAAGEEVLRERTEEWRRRLAELSWYMRALNEHIARRANREDGCRGRFWEGRFRSRALLDERAVLTCMSYVDLNPVRAGEAAGVRQARLTSVYERLQEAAGRPVRGNLVPFGEERGQGAPQPLGLGVGLGEYVELLEELSGAVGGEGELGEASVRRLAGMGLEPGAFVRAVRELPRTFFTMIGHVERIEVALRRRGQRRCPGIRAARRLYRDAA